MAPADPPPVGPLVAAADLLGTLVIVAGVAASGACLARGRGLTAARLAVADAAVTGLSLKTAGTLLKTIELRTWEQIGAFAAVLALRLVLKRVFVWEAARAGSRG